MSERELEIQKHFNRTTRGLWVVFVEGAERSIVAANEGRFVCHLNENMRLYQDDAEFIAAAHQDVPWLLQQLASERDEGKALVTARDQRIAALEEVLRWYAMPAIYECGMEDGHDCDQHGCWGDIDEDQGNAARDILAAAGPAARDSEGDQDGNRN